MTTEKKFTFVCLGHDFVRGYFKCLEMDYTFVLKKGCYPHEHTIIGAITDPYLQSPKAACIKDFDCLHYRSYPKG